MYTIYMSTESNETQKVMEHKSSEIQIESNVINIYNDKIKSNK